MPKRSAPKTNDGGPSQKKAKMNPQSGRQVRRTQTSGGQTSIANSFAAAAYASGQRVKEPSIRSNGRSTRIHHRELLGTVNGSTAFAVQRSIVINPALSASFPWLSTQAVGWEQYRFHSLKFEYITRCATTTIGSVILAPDYDSLDAAPSSELAATSYRDATEDAPWKDQCAHLDPTAMQPMGPRKYTRSGAVASGDLKTYDGGVMHVCTVEQANSDGIGKLWVEYDVELFVPQTSSGQASSPSTFAQFNLSSNQSLTTATPATVVFDEVVTNNLGIVNTSGVLTLPSGSWQILAEASVSGATSTTASLLLAIEKDNAPLAIPCESFVRLVNSQTTGWDSSLAANAFVSSNGSNTVRVRLTYTSVAGTLVAAGDRCRVSVRAC